MNLIGQKFVKNIREKIVFLKQWCANPRQLGSLVPSSRFLGKMMANEAVKILQEDAYLIEIGAGTGSLTQALLTAGINPERLICIEIDASLVDYLRKKFPQLQILQGNATNLKNLIPTSLHQKIGVIVSGLPMLNFSELVQDKIVTSCFDVMAIGGKIIQFSYSPFASIKCTARTLVRKRVGVVWRNFPPATVSIYGDMKP